jgi:hypothetical protein
MRKLMVSEFVSLDGVIHAPGGKDEMQDADTFLLARRTDVIHADLADAREAALA